MKDHKYTFDLKFLELILNITEAVDHFNACCVKIMTKSIAQVYLIIYKIVLNIIEDRSILRERYDKVLT